jgi:hypothetical protein
MFKVGDKIKFKCSVFDCILDGKISKIESNGQITIDSYLTNVGASSRKFHNLTRCGNHEPFRVVEETTKCHPCD